MESMIDLAMTVAGVAIAVAVGWVAVKYASQAKDAETRRFIRDAVQYAEQTMAGAAGQEKLDQVIEILQERYPNLDAGKARIMVESFVYGLGQIPEFITVEEETE